MGSILYYDGIFHSGVREDDVFSCMAVTNGKIVATYSKKPTGKVFQKEVSLGGQHVYPCLIDGHIHLLFTVAVMAMGFTVCQISGGGVQPNTIAGVEAKVRAYARKQKSGAIIAANNYILTAMDQQRMPTREELDDWGGGRPVVLYNIDGHSTALSSAMLRLLGLEPVGHSGILQGEENERVQGRLTDIIGAQITLPTLAKGVAAFQNACADYGIGVVGALEGNGDSPKDSTTSLIVHLARRFDVGVRFYFQYKDAARAAQYAKYQAFPRIGGCGDWEMDGAIGAHSAAFSLPYRDTGEQAPCYFTQEQADEMVRQADAKGFQIASHAIGDLAIQRILTALEQLPGKTLHRIEHCEFPSEESLSVLKQGRYALMMQPGYAWIDRRYLHTYQSYLPQELIGRQVLRSLYDAGICVCGSSDSPVQDLDPYLQMLGMVEHYTEQESVSTFEAFRCYTANPARALLEEDRRGTLEVGKAADFFTAKADLFSCTPEQLVSFRPTQTYYGGKPYRRKTGSVAEFLRCLLKKPRLV